jgi:hypothetical protein
MKRGQCFSESQLAQLCKICREEPRLVAVYAFDLRQEGDCNLAALFTETPPWPERLDLGLAAAEALGMEAVELINLRRMPLVVRFDVVNRGAPIFVSQPDLLAIFIEETIIRYSAFYPLLEALYWKVETKPLVEDQLAVDQ